MDVGPEQLDAFAEEEHRGNGKAHFGQQGISRSDDIADELGSELQPKAVYDHPLQLRLEALSPHPDNPRFAPREDVVEAIMASIAESGGFDPAHALIVRRYGNGFQIISGHHRHAAAIKAGLDSVPCWVREMDDAEAFMALVTSNAQGELTPLERGMHALKATEKGKHNGFNVSAYAEAVGRKQPTVHQEVRAARVANLCTCINFADLHPFTRHLAELHAAPSWFWPALVSRLLAENWTVENARRIAGGYKELPEPPIWANAAKIAEAVISGAMKAADVQRMINAAADAARKIESGKVNAAHHSAALQAGLLGCASYSEVLSACNKAVQDQSDEIAKIKREEAAKNLATAKEQERIAAEAARLKSSVSLDEWKGLAHDIRESLLPPDVGRSEVPGFNKQENAEIEWAQWSWNPITGCLHDCPYCYARDIALDRKMEKAYPNGFAPTLRPRSLLAPRFAKLPVEAERDTRFKNVFVCSMADLFGRWVPEEWIDAVLMEITAAAQWNFLCLTKFPKRMSEFEIPENAWMGTTVDLQARVAAAESGFAKVSSGVRWLSVEPMLEPLRFKRLDLFQWIVIGGSSRSSKTPEWKPPFPWIADLVQQAREAGTRVYFKTNLLGNRILELPFDAPIKADPVEAPAVFHYLGGAKDQNKKAETA